jgi:hypothetical protein
MTITTEVDVDVSLKDIYQEATEDEVYNIVKLMEEDGYIDKGMDLDEYEVTPEFLKELVYFLRFSDTQNLIQVLKEEMSYV